MQSVNYIEFYVMWIKLSFYKNSKAGSKPSFRKEETELNLNSGVACCVYKDAHENRRDRFDGGYDGYNIIFLRAV